MEGSSINSKQIGKRGLLLAQPLHFYILQLVPTGSEYLKM